MSLGDTAYSLWNAGFDACGYPKSLNRIEKESSMSKEPDWADEMAGLIYGDWILGGNFCTPVAIALRKARKDALEMAWQLALHSKTSGEAEDAIRAMIDDKMTFEEVRAAQKNYGHLGQENGTNYDIG